MARRASTLLILVVAHVATALLPASAARCHAEDKKALLAIKKFWNNPDHLASWIPSSDCCNWKGVDCDIWTDSVTGLSISDDANLTGTIPPSVGSLLHLRQLDFQKLPKITGPIPAVLTRLENLTMLRLESNGLTGPVPAFLGQFPELAYLNLGFNRLTGPIPGALGRLPKLSYLALDGNRLTGPVPPEFGKLPNDTYLLLSHNHLSGPLPPALGVVDFVEIDVSRNQLSGNAEFLFGESKTATRIDLSWNAFEFDLGQVLFPNAALLKTINLSHNKIYGRIPKQITSLPEIDNLDLSFNRLCGQIPVGGNMATFEVSVYAHNRCLCGKPLPPCK